MRFLVKRKDEDGIEPAYLANLTTMSTKKSCLTCNFCSKDDPEIFHTDDINIAAGLAVAIGGKVEVFSGGAQATPVNERLLKFA